MTTVVTTRLDADTLAGLDKLASHLELSRAWLVGEAVRRYVADETEFLASLQEAEDDFARGDFVTHKELMIQLKSRRRNDAA